MANKHKSRHENRGPLWKGLYVRKTKTKRKRKSKAARSIGQRPNKLDVYV